MKLTKVQAEQLAELVLAISEASASCAAIHRTGENLQKTLPAGYVQSRQIVLDEVTQKFLDTEAFRKSCWDDYHMFVASLTE